MEASDIGDKVVVITGAAAALEKAPRSFSRDTEPKSC